MADFNQFFQMLLLANPQMVNMGNPFMMSMNPDMMTQMMIQMMGLNGANINNLMAIFNPPPPPPQPTILTRNSHKYINLIFIQKNKNIRITVQAKYKESIGSVVNKYINKSGDNYINLYIINGRRLDESKTVWESGLIDNSVIDVVSVVDIEGA